MTEEEVTATNEQESSEEDESSEVTQPKDDAATLMRRLSGKDKALTSAQQKLATALKENAEYARWKAEREQADMSEVDKLQQRLERAEAEAAQARQDATIATLALKHPRGGKILLDLMALGDDPAAKMAYLDGLTAANAEATAPEPLNLADRPRKTLVTQPQTKADLEQQMKAQLEAVLAGA